MSPIQRLYRSRKDYKIAGVCGGIGERFTVDPTLVRLGVVFLALVTAIFPVLITYLIAWVIIPKAPKPEDPRVEIAKALLILKDQ